MPFALMEDTRPDDCRLAGWSSHGLAGRKGNSEILDASACRANSCPICNRRLISPWHTVSAGRGMEDDEQVPSRWLRACVCMCVRVSECACMCVLPSSAGRIHKTLQRLISDEKHAGHRHHIRVRRKTADCASVLIAKKRGGKGNPTSPEKVRRSASHMYIVSRWAIR